MQQLFSFALIGIGIGALYAICAQGVVLIYRGSGVVNFGQSGFVIVGGYTCYQLQQIAWMPTWLSVVGAVAAGAIVSAATYYLVMRPMKQSSPLARVVATLGVQVILVSAAEIKYGENVLSVRSFLPTSSIHIGSGVVTADKLILFIFGLVLTGVLWWVYRATSFGRIATAISENELAAASCGRSPDAIAGINWLIGGALAGLTGAAIAPITFLQPSSLNELILPALAAALLGSFSSFPLAFLAAILIGVGESVLTLASSDNNWWAGWPDALPFLIVIVYLVARGTSVPLRGHIFDKLPRVGAGLIRPIPVLVTFVLACVVTVVLPNSWSISFTVTVAMAIVCLSVLVVTGYAGQLSLGGYVLGAMGAWVAAKLMQSANVPFDLAFVIGVVAAMAIGLVLGLPSLRTRGVNLAITTLGISIALYALFLNNGQLAGSIGGIPVKAANILGFSVNPAAHPKFYGIAAVIALTLVALSVANLRRGVAGRRLLAVRSNERAAMSLGISVYGAKLYAFTLSSGIAAIGVMIYAFLNSSVVFSQFDVFSSITVVTSAVVGGVGIIGGSLVGANLISGGLSSQFLSSLSVTLNEWLPLIGGVSVLLILRSSPDGLFELNRVLIVNGIRKVRGSLRHGPAPLKAVKTVHEKEPDPVAVAPKTLVVRDLSVHFGGVHAVSNMSLTVRPGTVHGLIGPNGAGKTTFIDAVTGFVRASSGSIELDGVPLTKLSVRRRAMRGVGRSFQGGELFTDLTVRENLAVGGDDPSWLRYLTDLFHPGRIRLSDAAKLAAREFGLDAVYDKQPDALPFGTRRLVAIARVMAAAPSILLLDEPAAGLDNSEVAEFGHLIRILAEKWGIGVLLVEHNLDMVLSVCDEITVMAEGAELLAATTPEIVRTHPAVIEAYVGTADATMAG
jgi:ABC-type branched-subunit amino acid transport system ATPase component/ABC-type branched-subunit amino acid transport system permease subunit